ncbi:HpcH/HpaI aldolase/citrate lyase family protein [Paenibacillus thiaminolyticus]|uniref:HpcH/HpaI aldolase/citrate lyase family protein n=1 Tax=Paenibacillus thiaminolyticus TaxID=49283 RepID=UPI00232D8146|nr:HpcH/HpaI aldolase/citrate lyase family protein [Paenibacillus thiaminolyticus]WCF08367.1 HpcH/HpaI aldolase/citrate lyase family protein [Paenibacillus thiaminolyticus]
MRHFNYLSHEEEEQLFFSLPVSFTNFSDKAILSYAVGAALYMPATKPNFADDILSAKHPGLVSLVIDLEDAVGDNQVNMAEEMLCRQLHKVASLLKTGAVSYEHIPLLFIRVRSPKQLKQLIDSLEKTIEIVTGFMLPKFSLEYGRQYFEIINQYNMDKDSKAPILYGMPILETSNVIYRESRSHTLLEIKQLLNEYKEYVLNVRIGATDFSSLFGLRRSPDMTIYDIGVIRDCISDIINVFGRVEDQFVISGPVWEYFKSNRVLKTQLRQTPFEETAGKLGRRLRMEYINVYVDGLIREVAMDKENGIIGKTIIHPTHILPVQSLYVVTHEEYLDATNIIANNNGCLGVLKSQYANKMNEIKPHMSWAERIMTRSKVYGVLNENTNFTSLLFEQGGIEHEHAFV